jgi:hypothetical protein
MFIRYEIINYMKRVKPTKCYTMVCWTLWFAQHVSGIIMPIIRSLRPYRWPQRVAPHLGYGRLLVWCMAVGWSSNPQPCTRPASFHNQGEVPQSCNIPLPGRLNLQPCTRPACFHNQGEVPQSCNIPLPGRLNLQPCTRPASFHNQGEVPQSCNIPLPGRLNLQPCTRPAICHNQGEVPHAGANFIVASSWWWV